MSSTHVPARGTIEYAYAGGDAIGAGGTVVDWDNAAPLGTLRQGAGLDVDMNALGRWTVEQPGWYQIRARIAVTHNAISTFTAQLRRGALNTVIDECSSTLETAAAGDKFLHIDAMVLVGPDEAAGAEAEFDILITNSLGAAGTIDDAGGSGVGCKLSIRKEPILIA